MARSVFTLYEKEERPPKGLMKRVQRDGWEGLLGKRLGCGAFRCAYTVKHYPAFVIKKQIGPDSDFPNVQEWMTWRAYRRSSWAKYLAPVLAISPSGRWLLQRRAYKVGDETLYEKAAETLPGELAADCHPGNVGILAGKVVLIDYNYTSTLVEAPQ